MTLSSLPLKMDVPCGNRTHNYSLGGYCYIHLTKGTNGFATDNYYNKVGSESQGERMPFRQKGVNPNLPYSAFTPTVFPSPSPENRKPHPLHHLQYLL